MVKKKPSVGWRLFRYLLLSSGKGSIESFRILKSKNKSKISEIPLKVPTHDALVKEKPVSSKGKVNNIPNFQDFQIEKELSGEYEKFRNKLYQDSKIILIFGKRGSGKSALGLRIMENIRANNKRNCYVLGIGNELIPQWITSIKTLDHIEPESVILVDEGALSFSARESMKGANRELSKIMAIARHKNLTLIFITQNTGLIDKNTLKLADTLMIKEGSLLQLEMERPEIKKFYMKTQSLLDNITEEKVKYFYLMDSDFEGLLEHSLPGFWTNKLSKSKISY